MRIYRIFSDVHAEEEENVNIENVCHGREMWLTKDELYVTLARGSNHPKVKVMSDTRNIKVMTCLIVEDIRKRW